MSFPLNGQTDYATRSGVARYGGLGYTSSGNASNPDIAELPAAYGISGGYGLKCAANPNGTASRSAKPMTTGRWLHVEQDTLTLEVGGVLLDWSGDGNATWLELTNGNTVLASLKQTGTSGSPRSTLTIGGNDHHFSTPVAVGTPFTVRIIYERNNRVRVYVDGDLVVDESHSVDTAVRGWTLCCDVTGGDLQNEATAATWYRWAVWRNSALTPGDDAMAFELPPCHLGPPGTGSNGQRKQSVWVQYLRGWYGDGGDEDDLEVVFQLSTDEEFTAPDELTVDVTGTTNWCVSVNFDVDPLTTYWHRAIFRRKTGQVVIGTTSAASFRTLSAPNGDAADRLRIVVGGDSSEIRGHQPALTFGTIRTFQPDLLVHLGDIVYADQAKANGITANFSDSYEMNLYQEDWRQLGGECAAAMIWDGHEVEANWHNDSPPADLADGQAAYNHYVSQRNKIQPAPVQDTYTEGDTHAYYFDTAACRCIVLDSRRYREQGGSDPEVTNKGRLGSAQLAWAKNLLATNTKPFVLLFQQTPMSARWEPNGFPRMWWPSYVDERDELLSAFLDHNDHGSQLVIFSADWHSAAIGRVEETGTTNDLAPNVLEVICAPLNQATANPNVFSFDATQYTHYYREDANGVARAFALLDIDEKARTLGIKLIDGETGDTVYTHPTIKVGRPTIVAQTVGQSDGGSTSTFTIKDHPFPPHADQLIVLIGTRLSSANSVTGVTWGGIALEQLWQEQSTNGWIKNTAWVLPADKLADARSLGVGDVVATGSVASADWVGGALSLQGVSGWGTPVVDHGEATDQTPIPSTISLGQLGSNQAAIGLYVVTVGGSDIAFNQGVELFDILGNQALPGDRVRVASVLTYEGGDLTANLHNNGVGGRMWAFVGVVVHGPARKKYVMIRKTA